MGITHLVVFKMHGIGNDFLVIDGRGAGIAELFVTDAHGSCRFASELGHRHFGLGFDQLLLLTAPTDPSKADIFMRIFNSDGSTSGMCGNGVRCAAYFARHLAALPLPADSFKVETPSRIVSVTLISQPKASSTGTLITREVAVRVEMGLPDILSASLSVNSLEQTFVGYSISMGNPHFVTFLTDQKDASIKLAELSSFPVTTHGPVIAENTTAFPHKTNVEFVSTSSAHPEAVRMRVWERGAGETLACGSGACAVGAATILRSIALNKPIDNHKVAVHLPGGSLEIEWNPEVDAQGQPLHSLCMTGSASLVGKIEIEVNTT